MTLPVAFPSRRDTGSCVREGNKLCCVVCRRSAPAGGEGRPGAASVARLAEPAALPGTAGLVQPGATRAPPSVLTLPGSARSGPRRCEQASSFLGMV